jgi:hypothetical protein
VPLRWLPALLLPATAAWEHAAEMPPSAAHRSLRCLQDRWGLPGADPAKTVEDKHTGTWKWASNSGWTSGFFPGILWQLFNFTSSGTYQELATAFTAGREVAKTETSTHDIGFVIFDSFGKVLSRPVSVPESTPHTSMCFPLSGPRTVGRQPHLQDPLTPRASRLTWPPSWRDVVLTAAHSLARRYNDKVGMTRSWGHCPPPAAATPEPLLGRLHLRHHAV